MHKGLLLERKSRDLEIKIKKLKSCQMDRLEEKGI